MWKRAEYKDRKLPSPCMCFRNSEYYQSWKWHAVNWMNWRIEVCVSVIPETYLSRAPNNYSLALVLKLHKVRKGGQVNYCLYPLDGITDSMDMSLSKLWEGDCEGKRSLVCCSSWNHKDSDTILRLNNNPDVEVHGLGMRKARQLEMFDMDSEHWKCPKGTWKKKQKPQFRFFLWEKTAISKETQ